MSERRIYAVVIVVRNGEKFVGRALDSLTGQMRAVDEVVVVDDGSDDGTVAVVEAFRNRLPVRCVRLPKSGIAKARNAGNAAATAEFVVVLDADDELLPNALASYEQALGTEADLLYADCVAVKGRWRKRYRYPSFSSPQAMAWRTLTAFFVPFKHSAMCYRRQAIVELGGYDESLPRKVDIDLVLRAIRGGLRLRHVDAVVCIHHKHSGQTSYQRRRGLAEWQLLIERHLSDRPLQRRWAVVRRSLAELVKGALGA